jgi:hypothetical protein
MPDSRSLSRFARYHSLHPLGEGGVDMSLRQSAGMLVVIAVVIGVDMRLEWLVPLAMCCGGLAVYVVSLWEARGR